MISRMDFKHKKTKIEFISKYRGYAVESEHRHDIVYVADQTRFAVVDFEGLLFCPLEEVPALADKCKPKFKKEILDIYHDIMDMKRMEIIYA